MLSEDTQKVLAQWIQQSNKQGSSPLFVNQRAKLTRVLGKTALKSFHPRLCKIRYFVGEPWSVNDGYHCRSQKTTYC